MTSTDTASHNQVRFQLTVPPELADELSRIPDVTVALREEAPERVQHELALETVATVITILVNLDKLVPTAKRIAEHIHGYFSRSGDRQPRVKVTGEHDETVIEIHLGDAVTTADSIRIVVVK